MTAEQACALALRIAEIAPGLHSAGTLSPRALERIAFHAARRPVRCSAETGCGASTLLLSHLSPRHLVFAADGGSGSVANVRRSALLRAEAVSFVEGPTQATLPSYRFDCPLQFVLLDGPHAFPFPDLEYYFLYPHLEPGALVVLDDIQIRTVHHLFRFLRRDAMFRLLETAGTTAFFERTATPVFDPFGDGWQEQRYNRAPIWRYTWAERLKGLLPRRVRRAARSWLRPRTGARVAIHAPAPGAAVAGRGWVEGSAVIPPGTHVWVLVHRAGLADWWPQGEAKGEAWRTEVRYGEPRDCGSEFEIAAVVVGEATHDLWSSPATTHPLPLPSARFTLASAFRRVRKGSL